MENRNQNNVGMTFFHGLVVGAVLGLLFAPKKGEDLRKDLKGRIDQAANTVGTSGQELRDNLENARDNIVEKVEDVKENLTNKVEDTKEDVENKVNDTKRELRNKVDTAERDMNNKNQR